MTCRAFFDSEKDNDKKCKLLQELESPVLAQWETETASEHSPGIVKDDEVIYQQVVDPTHISPTGDGLLPKAFDVCSSHGLSTNRFAYSTLAELTQKGEARAHEYNRNSPDKPQRKLWGFVPFSVRDIRKIVCKETGARGLFVFDTADADDITHAEICQGGIESKSKIQARNVRYSLYELAKGNLRSLEELRE